MYIKGTFSATRDIDMNIPIEEENMKCGLKGQHVDNMRMG